MSHGARKTYNPADAGKVQQKPQPEKKAAKAEAKAEVKAKGKVEIDVQPTCETETTLSTEAPIENHTSTQSLVHIESKEQETDVGKRSDELKIDQAPKIEKPDQNEKVQSEKIQSEKAQSENLETGDSSLDLRAEIEALKSEIDTLQTQNTQLEEENAELIEICQTMDMEDEAANLKHFFGPEPVEAPFSTLLLLDKSLKLRSFNRAATESILKVDYMDIGQSMFKLFSAKQIDYKEVRTLETQIKASLDMGRSNYGEPIIIEISHKNKIYSISIVPMQAQAGKPIGVALSWVNI